MKEKKDYVFFCAFVASVAYQHCQNKLQQLEGIVVGIVLNCVL